MSLRFIYRCLKARFKDEKWELYSLMKHLNDDDIFIDVGANKGSYLLTMSKKVKKGMIYAFEPQPELSSYLRREIRDNKLQNVVVEQVALSNQKGNSVLFIPGSNITSPSATLVDRVNHETTNNYSVQTTTLDDYFSKISGSIGAIKIDVEGHERSVLEGALKIIDIHKPLIICEIENRHLVNDSVNDLLEYFHQIGYTGFFVHKSKGLIKIDEFDSLIHQYDKGEKFWNCKNYCNNFIMKKI